MVPFGGQVCGVCALAGLLGPLFGLAPCRAGQLSIGRVIGTATQGQESCARSLSIGRPSTRPGANCATPQVDVTARVLCCFNIASK